MIPAAAWASAPAASLAIHASAVVVGERAVILRGASGVGKSGLALALIETATSRGRFARLVADDRTLLRACGDRLVVAPHPAIAGMVERRFLGLSQVAHEDQAVAALVVDLALPDDAVIPLRMPEDAQATTVVAGVRIPRLLLPAHDRGAVEMILHRLQACEDLA